MVDWITGIESILQFDSLDGSVAQWCNPLTLQPKQPDGVEGLDTRQGPNTSASCEGVVESITA